MALKVIPPPGEKPIYRSDRYWEERAREKNERYRGAPEDPYAPRYNESFRSTTQALFSAQQPLTLDEVLKDFDERKFTFRLTREVTKDEESFTHQGILKRNSDGKSAAIKVITNRQGIQEILLNEKPITYNEFPKNQDTLYTFLFDKTGDMLESSLAAALYEELTNEDFRVNNTEFVRIFTPNGQHISSVRFYTDTVSILVSELIEKKSNETHYSIRYSDLPFQTKALRDFINSFGKNPLIKEKINITE